MERSTPLRDYFLKIHELRAFHVCSERPMGGCGPKPFRWRGGLGRRCPLQIMAPGRQLIRVPKRTTPASGAHGAPDAGVAYSLARRAKPPPLFGAQIWYRYLVSDLWPTTLAPFPGASPLVYIMQKCRKRYGLQGRILKILRLLMSNARQGSPL